MLDYQFVKSACMETILNGVKVLAVTHDHETCKEILTMIKKTCDNQIALEDVTIAYEKGDIKGMHDAMREHGFYPEKGV